MKDPRASTWEALMKQVLTGLAVLAALGCTSSTAPAGLTLHVEVVNKTTYPNYWANTRFS